MDSILVYVYVIIFSLVTALSLKKKLKIPVYTQSSCQYMVASLRGGGEGGIGVLQKKRHFLGTTSMFILCSMESTHKALPTNKTTWEGKGPHKDICILQWWAK